MFNFAILQLLGTKVPEIAKVLYNKQVKMQ